MFRRKPSERDSAGASARAGGEAGFTLIEALVALAVASVCLSAIGILMAKNNRAVRQIEQRVAAVSTLRKVATALPDRKTLAGASFPATWRAAPGPSPPRPIPIPRRRRRTKSRPSGCRKQSSCRFARRREPSSRSRRCGSCRGPINERAARAQDRFSSRRIFFAPPRASARGSCFGKPFGKTALPSSRR